MSSNLIDRTDPVQSRKAAWHQSTLSTLLEGCSWQYFLGYDLGIPQSPKPATSVGVAYHSALEAHENARLDGNTDGLPLDELLRIGSEEVKSQIDDEELVESCHAAIKNWWNGHREHLLQYTPVAVEPYFNVPLVTGARPIAGWVDGVYRDDRGLLLVDHKSARSFSRWHLDGSGHRSQATLYSVALALSDDYDTDDLVRMEYMVSRTSLGKNKNFEATRLVTVQPTLDDVKTLGDRIREAEMRTRERLYEQNTNWILCSSKWCPFFQGCQVDGTLSGPVQEVAERVSRLGVLG